MPSLDIGATIVSKIEPQTYCQVDNVEPDSLISINKRESEPKAAALDGTRCVSCFEDKGTDTQCPHCGWNVGDRPANPFYLPPGTILGGSYAIGKVLGHGGFGITYLGWDLELGIRIAIKEFLPDRIAGRDANHTIVTIYSGQNQLFENGLTKFQEEAQALAKFQQHPGIITVYRFLRTNSTGYMVMEYIQGITLKTYLTQQKDNRIPWAQAIGIMTPIMDALRAVHATGLLHRDIAPDNIYITQDKRVKLLDFGAARQAISEQNKSFSIILKEGFAPEEQYRRKGKQGPWTDAYGVAATIYCCITGEVPPASLDRMSADELKPLATLGINIAPKHEATLLRGLAIAAQDRWQTIEEMQQGLLEELPPIPFIPPPQQSTKNLWMIGLGLLALIGLGLVGIAISSMLQQTQANLDAKAYQMASKLNTDAAYQVYLAGCAANGCGHQFDAVEAIKNLAHEEGKTEREKIEREQRDNKAFNAAKMENTIVSYQGYLNNCNPDGCGYEKQADEALTDLRKQLDNIAFNEAQAENTEASYQRYIDNCRSNGCRYAKQANQELIGLRNSADDARLIEQQQRDHAAFRQAQSEDTDASYQQYIDNCHSDGCRHVKQASQELASLRIERYQAETRKPPQRDTAMYDQQSQEAAAIASELMFPVPIPKAKDGYLSGAEIRALVTNTTMFGKVLNKKPQYNWKEYQSSDGTAYFQRAGKSSATKGKWYIQGNSICWCYGTCEEVTCKKVKANANRTKFFYEDLNGNRTGSVERWENGDKTN